MTQFKAFQKLDLFNRRADLTGNTFSIYSIRNSQPD